MLCACCSFNILVIRWALTWIHRTVRITCLTLVDPNRKVPDLYFKVVGPKLQMTDLKAEVGELISGGIPQFNSCSCQCGRLSSLFASFSAHKNTFSYYSGTRCSCRFWRTTQTCTTMHHKHLLVLTVCVSSQCSHRSVLLPNSQNMQFFIYNHHHHHHHFIVVRHDRTHTEQEKYSEENNG